METTNCLGLDKFQLQIIKNNYSSQKPIINKRDKCKAKVQAAIDKEDAAIKALKEKTQECLSGIYKEMSAYDEQIAALDSITKSYTQRTCGIELTSEQVIKFLADTQSFEEYKKSIGIDNDLFQQEPYHENLDEANTVLAEFQM